MRGAGANRVNMHQRLREACRNRGSFPVQVQRTIRPLALGHAELPARDARMRHADADHTPAAAAVAKSFDEGDRVMKPRDAKTDFLKRLQACGLSLESLTVTAGVLAMLAYYAEERADGCPVEGDRDVLLFQWGTFDWGTGPAFEVDVTRQLIRDDTNEDEIWQLRLVFRFERSVGSEAGQQNRWCGSQDELPEFRMFVTESAALKAVAQKTAMSVELLYGPV